MIKTEEFKRPDHPDFMTAKELADINFSGQRMNSISNNAEIWLEGRLRYSISADDLQRNPRAIEMAMSELFQLDRIMPDHEEARKLGAIQDEVDNIKLNAPIIINSSKH